MATKLNTAALEKRLAVGETSKAELRAYTKLLQPLAKYKIHDILINGMPNPDRLTATLQVDRATLPGIAKDLGAIQDPALRGWKVFPKGIPWPEIFNIEVDVGRARG